MTDTELQEVKNTFNCSIVLIVFIQGYDSHCSPDKKELVIFRNDYILPQYIVYYKSQIGEFRYVRDFYEVFITSSIVLFYLDRS